MKKINISEVNYNYKEFKAIRKVFDSGWLTSGQKTIEFEKNVKKFLKCKNAIAVNSCTNGIFATLSALDIKKGDEVITSPLTFISTINTLYQFGMKIKLVDINLKDKNIDIDKLKKKITKKTKLLLITHYGGLPCDLDEIYSICRKKKLKVIEDSATVFGATYKKKYIGSFKNTISVFSFYANKIITMGEGGVITTDNITLAKKIKEKINLGITRNPWKRNNSKNKWQYDLKSPGYKFNLTDIQACLGIEQIKKVRGMIAQRKKIRSIYNSNFKNLINKKIIFVDYIPKNRTSAEYIYTIMINEKKTNLKRNDLINFLLKNNINTTVHYIPCTKLSFYKKLFKNQKFPNLNYVYRNILSIPFHNKMKIDDIRKVSNLIKKFFND